MVDESLPPIPGRKIPCRGRPSIGQVTARKGQRIPGYYESVTPRQGILQMNVAYTFAWFAQEGSYSAAPSLAPPNYESGGRRFESFRARQLAHCWHDCFVPCVGKLLPRRARRGSAVEAGTVLLLPSIRIERLMAVGGIGWGQA